MEDVLCVFSAESGFDECGSGYPQSGLMRICRRNHANIFIRNHFLGSLKN
jgi:hypothetical protein